MDNEMIERVTKAMVAAMGKLEPNDRNARTVAVETIKAMREPTEAIRGVGVDPDMADDYWRLMIDAIAND